MKIVSFISIYFLICLTSCNVAKDYTHHQVIEEKYYDAFFEYEIKEDSYIEYLEDAQSYRFFTFGFTYTGKKIDEKVRAILTFSIENENNMSIVNKKYIIENFANKENITSDAPNYKNERYYKFWYTGFINDYPSVFFKQNMIYYFSFGIYNEENKSCGNEIKKKANLMYDKYTNKTYVSFFSKL